MAIQTSGEQHIHILFEGEQSPKAEKQTPASPEQQGAPNKKDPLSAGSSGTASTAALHIGMSLTKQAANTAVSNIGLATGNYYKQQQVQDIMQAATTFAGVAMSVASGNIPALIMQVGGMAISAGSQIYQDYKQREHDNYIAAQLARRAGFTENRR